MRKAWLVLALPAAMWGCGGTKDNESADAAETRRADAAPAAPAAAPGAPDPELPRELELTARMLSKQLPLRHRTPQGMVTVSGIEARGTEMIHTVEVPSDLNPDTFEQFKAQLPARICEDNQLRQLLLRGGRQTYLMRDRDGEEFRATVERC